MDPFNQAWALLKQESSMKPAGWADISGLDNRDEMIENAHPHETHLCKHCGYPIFYHLQQEQGDGTSPPQEVWSGEDDEGGNCGSRRGFCEPGESLGRTYSDGSPIEATPESHPNQIWLNGRWVDVNDWTDEHSKEEADREKQIKSDGMMLGNWNDTWEMPE